MSDFQTSRAHVHSAALASLTSRLRRTRQHWLFRISTGTIHFRNTQRTIIYQPSYFWWSSLPPDYPVARTHSSGKWLFSTVTVAEGITGGEVGRTSEAHTNPIDDQWVTAQKAKGEHVDLQQLIAKIPQLRDISTIQARNARTETEAQDIPHLMMDYSISQEVMKSWNRGIIKDLKDIYVKLLYRANSGYRYRDEAYKRLILQTVDLLYKHEMIDVGLFRSFYDTDQMLESAAKNMVCS
ncbi:hypothetical protein PSTG_05439 [Puccinia striiformis f. sp. tritici PST-78]|uniref:Uncharacterized protein n=1 Tax=Puccinia striiformis f. sp. tritici PST-78 TaxID=1165861 RepID=A0A0L0VPY9_9BASI|nr:hypothetical protein PSTG_05439 [Puccinia striiformis f. sp. tritici PST-78]